MTSGAYKKFCDLYMKLNPDAKVVKARVLVHGGEWINGVIKIDDDQVLLVSPVVNTTRLGPFIVELEAVVGLQVIL